MRLLNTSTYVLKKFPHTVPPYVILSYTWDAEEVTFQDIQNIFSASKLKGLAKMSGCCHQARLAGYDWVWIDAHCIGKSSAAEVSEAINSMYKRYQRSVMCFAYLADVPRFLSTQTADRSRGGGHYRRSGRRATSPRTRPIASRASLVLTCWSFTKSHGPLRG